MSDLSTNNILRLNSGYQRIGWTNAQQAFSAMMGGADGSPPYVALDVQYELAPDGSPMVDKPVTQRPVPWEEWIKLPPRAGLDRVIKTKRGDIRVPTVVVCPNFHKMPIKEQRPTPSAIRKRDGNRCQYTGVELTKETFSLDHIVPRSKGGKDNWQNLVSAHKDVNSRKGDKWNHEAGLKLRKQPLAPYKTPLCALYTEVKHPDHNQF